MGPSLSNRSILLGWLSATLCLAIATLPNSASAQETVPVRIAVVKTDPDDGSELRDRLADAVDARADTTLVASGELLDASDEKGIDREDYLKGSRRAKLTDDFASVLETIDADAMFLVDMISGGDRVQLVVIGPNGEELADIRVATDKAGGDTDAVLVEPALDALPKPLFTRKANAENDATDVDKAASGEPAEDEKPAESASDSGAPTTEPGVRATAPKRRAVQLSAGAFFGRRTFNAESSVDYALTNVVPLVGARVDASVRLARWAEGASALRLDAHGAWAPYSVEFGAFNQNFNERGMHISGRLDVVYLQALTPGLSARVTGGGDIVSDTVEANPVFTGSRYTNGRLTVGVVLHPVDVFELTLSGGVMPLITAETSGASYGDSSGGIGYTAAALLKLTMADGLDLTAGYDLRAYQTTFPSPDVIDSAIETSDQFHTAIFGLTYGF
jgi:hypothetical protein